MGSVDNTRDYTLKIATPDCDFFDLLSEAIQESPYRYFEATDEDKRNLMHEFTKNPEEKIALLLCYGDTAVGILAASVSSNILCPRWKVASENLWYVTKEHRGKASKWLLDAYEFWAKKMGAKVIHTASFGNKVIDRLYKQRGYTLVEHSFIKVI